MSWLARSLANSLRLDDDNDDDDDEEDNDVVPSHPPDSDSAPSLPTKQASHNHHQQQQFEPEDIDGQSEEAYSRGVKDDISELKQTLTRQLWGVASFLAPPPSSQPSTPSHFPESEPSDLSASSGGEEEPSDQTVSGIRSDILEISKMASNEELLEARGLGGAVGITDEVLAFAGNIAMHPETWLDFPLDEEEDLDGMCVSFSVIVVWFSMWSFTLLDLWNMMHLLPWIRNWGFELLIHCSVAHIKLPNPICLPKFTLCATIGQV